MSTARYSTASTNSTSTSTPGGPECAAPRAAKGCAFAPFLVEPDDALTDPDALLDPAGALPPGTLVYAVRTDLSVDPAELAAAIDALPAPPEPLDRMNRRPADVVPLPDRRFPDAAGFDPTGPDGPETDQ